MTEIVRDLLRQKEALHGPFFVAENVSYEIPSFDRNCQHFSKAAMQNRMLTLSFRVYSRLACPSITIVFSPLQDSFPLITLNLALESKGKCILSFERLVDRVINAESKVHATLWQRQV